MSQNELDLFCHFDTIQACDRHTQTYTDPETHS